MSKIPVTTDEALMRDVQRGVRGAFEQLFDRYRGPVWRFFRRRVSSAARAEELAQDTFVAVLQGAARYEPRALFRSYLFGIAYNILLADQRKASHRLVEPLTGEPAAVDSGDPEVAIWVRDALAALDADDRDILMLREYRPTQLRRDRRAQGAAAHHRSLAAVSRADGTQGNARAPGGRSRKGDPMTAIEHPLSPDELMEYLDGELTVEQAAAVQAHVAACIGCQRLSAELRAVSRDLARWQVEGPPATFEAPQVAGPDRWVLVAIWLASLQALTGLCRRCRRDRWGCCYRD